MKRTDMNPSKNLILNVRNLAAERGIPLSEIERNSGLCRGFLSRTGDSGVNLSTAASLANAVNASLDELILQPTDQLSTEQQIAILNREIARLQLRRAELIMLG